MAAKTMHLAYRQLFDRLSTSSATCPALADLLTQVENLDNIDPLRVPAIKAMKRSPAPPLSFSYEFQGPSLTLAVRNTVRKRKASAPTRCAEMALPAWLREPNVPLPPGLSEALQREAAELVVESFGLLETRVGNYFVTAHDNHVVVCVEAPALLRITP